MQPKRELGQRPQAQEKQVIGGKTLYYVSYKGKTYPTTDPAFEPAEYKRDVFLAAKQKQKDQQFASERREAAEKKAEETFSSLMSRKPQEEYFGPESVVEVSKRIHAMKDAPPQSNLTITPKPKHDVIASTGFYASKYADIFSQKAEAARRKGEVVTALKYSAGGFVAGFGKVGAGLLNIIYKPVESAKGMYSAAKEVVKEPRAAGYKLGAYIEAQPAVFAGEVAGYYVVGKTVSKGFKAVKSTISPKARAFNRIYKDVGKVQKKQTLAKGELKQRASKVNIRDKQYLADLKVSQKHLTNPKSQVLVGTVKTAATKTKVYVSKSKVTQTVYDLANKKANVRFQYVKGTNIIKVTERYKGKVVKSYQRSFTPPKERIAKIDIGAVEKGKPIDFPSSEKVIDSAARSYQKGSIISNQAQVIGEFRAVVRQFSRLKKPYRIITKEQQLGTGIKRQSKRTVKTKLKKGKPLKKADEFSFKSEKGWVIKEEIRQPRTKTTTGTMTDIQIKYRNIPEKKAVVAKGEPKYLDIYKKAEKPKPRASIDSDKIRQVFKKKKKAQVVVNVPEVVPKTYSKAEIKGTLKDVSHIDHFKTMPITQASKPALIPTAKPRSSITPYPMAAFDIKAASVQRLDPIQKSEVKPDVIQEVKPVQKLDVSQKQNIQQKISQKQKVSHIQRVSQIQRVEQKQQVEPVQEVVPTSAVSFGTAAAPKPAFSFSQLSAIPFLTPTARIKQKAAPSVFDVEVRRRGKFRTFAAGLEFKEAVSTGRGIVEGTAAASFRITSKGRGALERELFNVLPRDIYRESKRERGVFVQKKKKRISSSGELAEIKIKRGVKPWAL
jgi:hypothetical protein